MEDKKILNFVKRNLIISQGLSKTIPNSEKEQELHIQRCIEALKNSSLKESNLLQQLDTPEHSLEDKREIIWKIIRQQTLNSINYKYLTKYLVRALFVIAIALGIKFVLKASEPHPPWQVNFYGNIDMHGDSIAEREDYFIDYEWAGVSPINRVDGGQFSAIWKSCLVLSKDKNINFNLGSDDGSRLIIDGNKVIESWQIQGFTETSKQISLTAGAHLVEVQYYQDGGASRVKFDIDNKSYNSSLKSTLGAFSPCKK